MARGRGESTIPCKQRGSEFIGKHDIGSIVGRKIVTQLPNPGQEYGMRIPSNAEIHQIADCLVTCL